MTWDKNLLKKLLLEKLDADLQAILLAASTAHEGATHSDAQAKSKYDTHGLELSYIAGSQYERARAMQAQILKLSSLTFDSFAEDDPIDLGAIICILPPKGAATYFLLSQIGAGISLPFEGRDIRVLSPESPLGEVLIGLGAGDKVKLGPIEQGTIQSIG